MCALPARTKRIRWPSLAMRLAVALAISLLLAYALIAVAAILQNSYLLDGRGYWDTGWSLRTASGLYPPVADQDGPFVYRYAPWFAWWWAALTFLPRDAVLIGWGVALGAASVWLLVPLPRNATSLALGLIFGPMLLSVVSRGNVQPLLLAATAWGLMHRSGPVWVGLAASLKLVPILFATVYVERGEYRRFVAFGVVTVALWLPALLYGLEHYPSAVGGEAFPFEWSTFLIAAVALAAVLVVPSRQLQSFLAVRNAPVTTRIGILFVRTTEAACGDAHE